MNQQKMWEINKWKFRGVDVESWNYGFAITRLSAKEFSVFLEDYFDENTPLSSTYKVVKLNSEKKL